MPIRDKRKRAEYERLRYQKQKDNPEYKARQAANRKRNRLKNVEKERERARQNYANHKEHRNKQRAERAKKNRERERENARKSYQRNKQTRIKRVSEYKDRVNPARVLTRTLHEFKQGIISFSEFLDKFGNGALSNNEGSKK